jgi:RimJ/RimL family protein N-acetyltransferase
MSPPLIIRTTRLCLRRWQERDAASLLPLLVANEDHLGPWIPKRVAAVVPLDQLSQRLAGYGADFDADREWRFAVCSGDESTLLGEASLFPRTARERVPLANADRLEIGYWIRSDATGLGFATEAAKGLLTAATRMTGLTRAEIRCDARNLPSAAIPRRLGFRLSEPTNDSPNLMVWTIDLTTVRDSDGEES